ncbi:hypothetical protein [Bosea sp. (in: a-proteobacteria)]|uniref:hypothetical protein n=1 Tax=Bosea sp. (in: a-proteobacteria) TaxID=1871050 RepID=UPI002733AE91|nr:hypothetical protein [Bosea sp. (in: a-proteobacteria)]MDP3409540.1 hypothetical protein [Bosea sp. (in: a-proteobacteria)]
MTVSAGLIGALIGLVLGIVEYRIVSGLLIGALRRTDRSQTQAERDDYERRIGFVRAALVVLMIGVTPVLGYLIGQTVFG